MHSTRKLTRAEACAALARMIWPTCDYALRTSGGADVRPTKNYEWGYFDPFTSRDAAAELVAWLSIHTLWETFVEHLNAIICEYDQSKYPGVAQNRGEVAKLFKRALLATPEQITLAACRALGIDTGLDFDKPHE